jgi:hypothetical protein
MNFIRLFHEVFLICKEAVCAGVKVGRYGRMRSDMMKEEVKGKTSPYVGELLWSFMC